MPSRFSASSHNCNLEDIVVTLYAAVSESKSLKNPAELFRQETNTLQLAPGEFLYREGDKADKMYILLEGKSTSGLVIMSKRQRKVLLSARQR